MLDQKKESRWVIQSSVALFLVALVLGPLVVGAFPQSPPKPGGPVANPKAAAPLPIPCCIITAINVPADLVTAQVKATGQTFQFKVNDPAVLKSLRVGEAVWANFKTGQVSVDGRTICGTIVSMGGTQVRSTPSAGAITGTLAPSSAAPAPQPATPAATPAPSKAAPLVAGVGSTPAPACCGITVIHVSTRLVDAQVNTSPTTRFTFSVPSSIAIQNLTVGQPVWANFKTMQVSLNGQTACCRIVSGSPQQASKPGLMAPAGAAPGVGAAGSSSATSAPASAGQPKTEAAPVTPGGLAGLKQAGPAINLPAPPQIQNFGVFPGPIPGGDKDVGQVVLTGVPPSGATVQLSSDQPSVASVPAQIQVSGSGPSAGSAVIVVNTSPVTQPTDVTLSAQVAGSSDVRTTKLTVRPPQPSIFQCSPSSVISGTPIACKVWLDGAVASTLASRTGAVPLNPGMPVQISTNNSEVASMPGGAIFVPEGATLAEFQVPTTAYPEPVDVIISASSQGSTPMSASVKLTPAAIRSFGCVPKSYAPWGATGSTSCETFGGGINHWTTIAMTFSGPSPAGFVNVTSDSGAVWLCKAVGVPCQPSLALPLQTGAKWEASEIVVLPVSVPTTATLSAVDPLSKLVKSVQIKIDPPAPASIRFQSQDGTVLTSISNVLAGGQQVQTYVSLTDLAPDDAITFDVNYSASDAAGNPLQGAVSGPQQIAVTRANAGRNPYDCYYVFSINVQPCEVNAPCKVSVTVGSATGTLYVNP